MSWNGIVAKSLHDQDLGMENKLFVFVAAGEVPRVKRLRRAIRVCHSAVDRDGIVKVEVVVVHNLS